MPKALEVEQAVLGAVMRDNDAFYEVIERVTVGATVSIRIGTENGRIVHGAGYGGSSGSEQPAKGWPGRCGSVP